MHTSAFKSVRIHYDNSFYGECCLTNDDSSSTAVGKKTYIQSDMSTLIYLYKKNKIKNPETVKIEGTTIGASEKKETITILFSDLKDLMKRLFVERITKKLEEGVSLDRLERIGTILGIKL